MIRRLWCLVGRHGGALSASVSAGQAAVLVTCGTCGWAAVVPLPGQRARAGPPVPAGSVAMVDRYTLESLVACLIIESAFAREAWRLPGRSAVTATFPTLDPATAHRLRVRLDARESVARLIAAGAPEDVLDDLRGVTGWVTEQAVNDWTGQLLADLEALACAPLPGNPEPDRLGWLLAFAGLGPREPGSVVRYAFNAVFGPTT